MKVLTGYCWIVAFLLATVLHTHAQEAAQPQLAPKYRLELIYIFETREVEYIFVIGNSGFRSVASLKDFIGNLPAGSTLEWAPGCRRQGDEPLISSAQDLEEFKAFCAEKGINFVLIPSG